MNKQISCAIRFVGIVYGGGALSGLTIHRAGWGIIPTLPFDVQAGWRILLAVGGIVLAGLDCLLTG